MKKVLTTLCLSASIASASMILGFGVEADYFTPEITGDFQYTDNGVSNTNFNGESDSSYQLGLYFEHPIPVVPNFRVDFTPDTTFTGSDGSSGTNTVTFAQTDITAYYEILDNIIDIDVGITGKIVKGDVAGTSINQSGSMVIPMGYVAAGISIPAIPVHVDADIKYIGYNDNTVSDMRIKAVWEVVMGLEVAAGYRYESLDLDGQDILSTLKIKGPFVGVGYRF